MTFQVEKDGERRRKSEQNGGADQAAPPRSPRKRTASPEIGSALRSVYQRAIDEDIPPEMLDLLGKLG